jgi:hypothetical protein
VAATSSEEARTLSLLRERLEQLEVSKTDSMADTTDAVLQRILAVTLDKAGANASQNPPVLFLEGLAQVGGHGCSLGASPTLTASCCQHVVCIQELQCLVCLHHAWHTGDLIVSGDLQHLRACSCTSAASRVEISVDVGGWRAYACMSVRRDEQTITQACACVPRAGACR